MTDKIKKELEKIAMEVSYVIKDRGGLDERRCGEDFFEISVWEINDMLEKAYELGKKTGGK